MSGIYCIKLYITIGYIEKTIRCLIAKVVTFFWR